MSAHPDTDPPARAVQGILPGCDYALASFMPCRVPEMDLSLSLSEFQTRKELCCSFTLWGKGELQTQSVPRSAGVRHPQCWGEGSRGCEHSANPPGSAGLCLLCNPPASPVNPHFVLIPWVKGEWQWNELNTLACPLSQMTCDNLISKPAGYSRVHCEFWAGALAVPPWGSVCQEGISILPTQEWLFHPEMPGSGVAQRKKKGFLVEIINYSASQLCSWIQRCSVLMKRIRESFTSKLWACRWINPANDIEKSNRTNCSWKHFCFQFSLFLISY